MRGPRSSPDRRALGAAAEDAAATFIESGGLRILLRNFRCRFGELDFVALEPPDLLIVGEVRLRSRADFGGAAASVDVHKQRRLQLTTRFLFARRPTLSRLRVRFDVLEVRPSATASGFTVHWIRDAFRG